MRRRRRHQAPISSDPIAVPGAVMSAWSILGVGLALGLAFMVRSYPPLTASQVLGRALAVQAKVEVAGPDGVTAALRAGMPLRAGDALKTGDGGAAALSLTPGIVAWLSEGSELKIEELRMGERGEDVEERFARLRLKRGAVTFSVGGTLEDHQVDLRVLMASIEIGAKPRAAFNVSAQEDGGGRLLCTAGAVHWRDDARAQSGWVLSGQFQDCGAGAPSVARSISSDGTAQPVGLALLDSVWVLNRLQDQLSSDLIPRAVKAGKGADFTK